MSRICLITALAAETRPLLDAMACRQQNTRHLRLYESDHCLILETGLGKLNAAAATGAILQLYPDIAVVANIGIAGGLFNIGQTLVAHRVQDQASGAQWFPHLPDSAVFRNVCSATMYTVDTPSTDYCEGVLFDMEAAGIFTAATRHLSTSQVHSLKVVSDNPDNSLQTISKNRVEQLIGDALPRLMPMLDVFKSRHCASSTTAPNRHALSDIEPLINTIKQAVHHSVNDEHQLRRLLQQHLAVTGTLPPSIVDWQAHPASDVSKQSVEKAASASALRHQVRAAITSAPFVYGDAQESVGG